MPAPFTISHFMPVLCVDDLDAAIGFYGRLGFAEAWRFGAPATDAGVRRDGCTIMLSTVERQLVPAWMVAIILCREMAITGLRAVAAGHDIIIAADTFGKYKMVCLIIGAFLLMLNVPMLYVPGIIALSMGLVLGVISGVEYMRSYLYQIL